MNEKKNVQKIIYKLPMFNLALTSKIRPALSSYKKKFLLKEALACVYTIACIAGSFVGHPMRKQAAELSKRAAKLKEEKPFFPIPLVASPLNPLSPSSDQ